MTTTAAQTYLTEISKLALTADARKALATRLRLLAVTPGAAIQMARLLVAARTTEGEVMALCADTAWTNATELRHAICALRAAKAPAAAPVASKAPSIDADCAAREELHGAYKAGRRALPPTSAEIKERALAMDAARQTPPTTPAPAKLQAAREALVAAERKATPAVPVVEVRFTDLEGNTALVPSSAGAGAYTVRLRDGVAYQCGCAFNLVRGLTCKHMAAAERAYMTCDAQPGTVLRARVELTPKRLRAA